MELFCSFVGIMAKEIVNPFVGRLEVKVFKMFSQKKYLSADGLMEGQDIIPAIGIGLPEHKHSYSYYVESETSTRLYRNPQTEDLIKKLSDRASKMLLYVMRNLAKDAEQVSIDIDGYMGEYNIDSKQTVYSAITDLSEAGVIQRFKPGRYWINPAVLFNGNRVKKYSDKVHCEYEISNKNG